MPVAKSPDETVFGATANLDGVLYIRVTSGGDQSMLSQIVSLVEGAQVPPRAACVCVCVCVCVCLTHELTYERVSTLQSVVGCCSTRRRASQRGAVAASPRRNASPQTPT